MNLIHNYHEIHENRDIHDYHVILSMKEILTIFLILAILLLFLIVFFYLFLNFLDLHLKYENLANVVIFQDHSNCEPNYFHRTHYGSQFS
jgi:hypothetical protein